jgi:hypothetical protein
VSPGGPPSILAKFMPPGWSFLFACVALCPLPGVGLLLALAVARAVGSFVVVNVWDPTTYVGVGFALAFAALLSCYFPARRAMTVEPMVALRDDQAGSAAIHLYSDTSGPRSQKRGLGHQNETRGAPAALFFCSLFPSPCL